MNTELEKQFRKDNPQTIGETDKHFDLSNYNDWLEFKYSELLKQNKEMREILNNVEIRLNEFHNDLAKSVLDMKTYQPLSSQLLDIKNLLQSLKQ